MKNLKFAIKSDFLFQFKEGFFFIYFAICIIYLIILSVLPNSILSIVLPILVFSDPAGIGLFFIGGMFMLERRQGIINYLVITPLLTKEYILSKVITLSTLAVLVSLIITAFTAISTPVNYFILSTSTFLAAIFFTLFGILIALNCNNLNEYFVKIIPWMILLSIPCLSLIGIPYGQFLSIIPSVASIRLIFGAYHSISLIEYILLSTYMLLINFVLITHVEKKFDENITFGG